MKSLLFIGHSIYINKNDIFDPNKAITFEFLDRYFLDSYKVIRHSLYRGGETRLYFKGINNKYIKIPIIGNLPDIVRYITEIIFNFFYLLLLRPKRVIAIDPLSCLIPTLLKKIKLVEKVYFITPDFSKQRFNNNFINKIYFFIDWFCTMYSDKNLCCSKTVIKYKETNYTIKHSIYIHLPNIPNPWIINDLINVQKVKNRIIYVGNISLQIDFWVIFSQIQLLKNKYPDITLYIFGAGNMVTYLKNYISENNFNNIFFLGQLSYRNTLKEIAKSEIGIALYNGSFCYDEFRDSCKIREYQALSTIPLISNIVKSNADEIQAYKSGLIVTHPSEIYTHIDKILDNEIYASELRKNCRNNYLLYSNKFQEFYSLLQNGI